MGVNQNDIALLRIGSVTAVKTSGIDIAVDSDKNEPSILYKGDIIDNVTTDSYVMIQRGYRKLVALVEEEYLTEDRQWRDDKYHRDADRYRRTLRASLQGELIDVRTWPNHHANDRQHCLHRDKTPGQRRL